MIVQFFPWYMTNIAEPKLVNVTHWNRRLLKWTKEFYILLKILSFKMFTWFMKSKDCCGRGYFSPDFSPGIPRCRIDSFEVLPAIQRNPRVQVKFVLVRSFWSRYGKNKTVIEMFYTSEHFLCQRGSEIQNTHLTWTDYHSFNHKSTRVIHLQIAKEVNLSN